MARKIDKLQAADLEILERIPAPQRQPPAPLRASPRRCRRHRHGRRWHLFTNKQCSQILD
jgi:hypothetical protein